MPETEPRADGRASFGIHRDHLDAFLAQLDAIVDEAKVRFEPEGLRSHAKDPANVAMTETTLDAEALDSYAGDGTVIGCRVDRLRHVLHPDLLPEDDGPDRAEVAVHRDARKVDVRLDHTDMTLAYIDPDVVRQAPDMPDLDLSTEVILDARLLTSIVAWADTVSDHLTLGFDHDEWQFYATAEGDTDDMDVRPPSTDIVDVSSSGDAHSVFSLNYLKDAIEPIPDEALVTLHIDEEYPLRLAYDYGPDGHGHTECLLSPRITSDGD